MAKFSFLILFLALGIEVVSFCPPNLKAKDTSVKPDPFLSGSFVRLGILLTIDFHFTL